MKKSLYGYLVRECQVKLTRIDVDPMKLPLKLSKKSKQIETGGEASDNENSDSEKEQNNEEKLKIVTTRKMSLKRKVNSKATKTDGRRKTVNEKKNKASENADNDSEASESEEISNKKHRGRSKKVNEKKSKASENADNDSEGSESEEGKENKKKPKRVEIKKRNISEVSSEASESEESDEGRKTRRKKNEDSEASSENEEERKKRKRRVFNENESDEESEIDSSGSESIHTKSIKQHSFKPRLLKCKECEEKFKLYAALQRHQKVHKSVKFPCVLCGDKFKTRQQFANHMNEMHPEVELYPCLFPGCNASFKRKKQLTDHENVHFKYMCRFCKRRFGRQKMMRLHVQEVHF